MPGHDVSSISFFLPHNVVVRGLPTESRIVDEKLRQILELFAPQTYNANLNLQIKIVERHKP